MFKALWITIVLLASPLCMSADLHNPDHVQVYIVPMSDFPEEMAVKLARVLSEDMGFWVKSSLRLGNLGIAVMPGTFQLPAEEILAKCQPVIRSFTNTSPKTYFLLLTLRDINSQTQGFRFQFSMHNKDLNTSVLSMARLFDYQNEKPVLNEIALTRLFKMSKRAIGEMHLGWERSINPQDVMYSPLMGIPDLDRIGTEYLGNQKTPEPDAEPTMIMRSI